jgi:hypothetical protein
MQAKDIIEIIIWTGFFTLYFFGTQKIYSDDYSCGILITLLILSVVLFIALDKKHPELKMQYSAFLISHYCLLLLLIKLTYRKLYSLLAKKGWVSAQFGSKDFTHVTLGEYGDEQWEHKITLKPNWLDHVLSIILIFAPILLMLWTMSLFTSNAQ